MGRVQDQILLVGGLVEDESEPEEIEMWPQEAEEEAGVSEESEEEDGPGPPLKCISPLFPSFPLSFILRLRG